MNISNKRFSHNFARLAAAGLVSAWMLFQPVQASGPADEAVIDSALLRMALVVADIEASSHFYRHVLGYRPGFEGDITRPSVSAMLGLAEGQTARFAVLHGAEAIDGLPVKSAMLGLLQVGSPALPAMRRPDGHLLAAGETMMAIVTNDIKLAHQRAQELGVRVLYPPAISADGQESEMVLHDPDGVRIHVVQRWPQNR